jgi:membrane protease YdiL (CAAX protease family)
MTLTLIGLAVALLFGPAILLAVRRLGGDALSLWPRLALWLLALACVLIAAHAVPRWQAAIGLKRPAWGTFTAALAGVVAVLAAWPALQVMQKLSGGTPTVQTGQFLRLAALPVGYRCFLVLTAGVTEEVLYRGYGIGVGAGVLGGAMPALAVSLAVFTVAHFSWGPAHLVSVLWAGAVLSMLFVASGDLLACVAAHTVVDAVGLVFAPMAMVRRQRRIDALDKTR